MLGFTEKLLRPGTAVINHFACQAICNFLCGFELRARLGVVGRRIAQPLDHPRHSQFAGCDDWTPQLGFDDTLEPNLDGCFIMNQEECKF